MFNVRGIGDDFYHRVWGSQCVVLELAGRSRQGPRQQSHNLRCMRPMRANPSAPSTAGSSFAPVIRPGSRCTVHRTRWAPAPFARLQFTRALNDALEAAVDASAALGGPNRVLNVSSAAVVDLLREKGVLDVLSVVADGDSLAGPAHRPLGNDAAPRTWVGGVESVPPYMGPFSVAIVDQDRVGIDGLRAALLKVSLMMRPGGHTVVYCSQGGTVEHVLIERLARDLCFEVVEGGEIAEIGEGRTGSDTLVFRVPENFAVPNRSSPIWMEGEVVNGYGRGSRKLGVPTANLRPADVASETADLPLGVYFGFARIRGVAPEEDVTVRKMVMNIGKRPTFVKDNGPEESIEVHVMDYDGPDFYGQRLAVVICGFLRPEMKFDGLDALLNRIQTDIGMSRSQLDAARWTPLKAELEAE